MGSRPFFAACPIPMVGRMVCLANRGTFWFFALLYAHLHYRPEEPRMPYATCKIRIGVPFCRKESAIALRTDGDALDAR